MARPKEFDRTRVLDKAMRLFWARGYEAVSIQDLVEAMGINRQSLYDTFGDKRTLFLDALKLYSKSVLSRVERTLTELPSPVDAIRSLFDDLAADVGSESGAMGCFMVNSIAELTPYDADVTEIASAYSDTFQRLLAQALERAASQKLVTTKQTPEQLAAYIFNIIQGLRIVIKSGATREQVQAISIITLNSLQ